MTDLTKSSFEKIIKKGISVIEFYAGWCSPCKEVSKHLDSINKKFPKVKTGRVNVDKNAEIASEYFVVNIPCFLIFKDGEEVERLVDTVPIEVLENEVESRSES